MTLIGDQRLLNSMYEMDLRGRLPAFADGFLSDKRLSMRVGASYYEYLEQEDGLPQGSIFSVPLFVIALNNMIEQLLPHMLCTLYVDGFTIFVSQKIWLPQPGLYK